jgi:hypothetical protein
MTRLSLLLWLGLVSGVTWAQSSEPPQVVLRGTVTTSSGEHPAWFTLICTQGTGAALSMQLMLGTDAAPDFPFTAFEGPRAPGSFQPSAQLQVGKQRFAPTTVAGWFSADRQGAFVFGIATAVPSKPGTATDVAAALGHVGATLRWTQLSNNLQTPPLAAQFTLDAQQSRALKQIAAPCLPRLLHNQS